jgi:uncharacterized radical SAM superfamily protein
VTSRALEKGPQIKLLAASQDLSGIGFHIVVSDRRCVPRRIDCYRPGASFPAVSVTGASCSLGCKHCTGRYLDGMRPATSPDALLKLAEELEGRGSKGFLLSGGSDRGGKVPLGRFVPALRRIKDTTSLLVNAHVGLAPRNELEELVRAGVDAFSVDVYGARSTIREVSGLGVGPEAFLGVVTDLKDLGAPTVAPHICVGVERGVVVGEMSALESLAPIRPDAVVLLALMPTRGTPYEGTSPPTDGQVLEVVRMARATLPGSRVLLGCMRPRNRQAFETEAARAGVDGIAMPSRGTVSSLKADGWEVTEKRTCCVLP